MYSLTLQELPLLLQVVFNIAATTTLVVWNTFLTLDEEIEFIWSSNFTFVKGLFFVVRYLTLLIFCETALGFFGNIKANLCSEVIWFITIGGFIVTTCSNILLIQRVYAFYGRSKYIFWTLCSGFVLSEIVVVAILILGLPSFRAAKNNLPSPIPDFFGHCFIETYPRIFSYGWFCKLAFEAVAFICIVARCAKLQFAAWKTGLSNPRLHNVFLRDGTWAFFILLLFFLSTGILMHAQNVAGLSFALWSYALSSICSTRLILNLHYAAKKSQCSDPPLWDTCHQEVPLAIVIK